MYKRQVVGGRWVGGVGGCVCESVVVGEVSAEAVGGRMERKGGSGGAKWDRVLMSDWTGMGSMSE